MVDRFDPPRDLDWKPLPMRPDIVGQYVRYCDLAAAQAELVKLKNALTEISLIENEMFGGDWDEIEKARNIAKQAIT